jgi:hypothetical protein
MSRWVRTPIETRCGYCGQTLAIGTAVCLFQTRTIARPKVRCPACACEPVPELPALDLPTLPHSTPVPAMRRLGLLPLDEDREPGQEG